MHFGTTATNLCMAWPRFDSDVFLDRSLARWCIGLGLSCRVFSNIRARGTRLFARWGCGGDINWGRLRDLLHARGCFGSSCALCRPHMCWDHHLTACWHSTWIKFTSFTLSVVVWLFLSASILWVRATLSPKTTSWRMWWFRGVRQFTSIMWPPVLYTGLTAKVFQPTLRFIHHSR